MIWILLECLTVSTVRLSLIPRRGVCVGKTREQRGIIAASISSTLIVLRGFSEFSSSGMQIAYLLEVFRLDSTLIFG